MHYEKDKEKVELPSRRTSSAW